MAINFWLFFDFGPMSLRWKDGRRAAFEPGSGVSRIRGGFTLWVWCSSKMTGLDYLRKADIQGQTAADEHFGHAPRVDNSLPAVWKCRGTDLINRLKRVLLIPVRKGIRRLWTISSIESSFRAPPVSRAESMYKTGQTSCEKTSKNASDDGCHWSHCFAPGFGNVPRSVWFGLPNVT